MISKLNIGIVDEMFQPQTEERRVTLISRQTATTVRKWGGGGCRFSQFSLRHLVQEV